MPRRRKTPLKLPPNPTEWQIAIFAFMEKYPLMPTTDWAKASGVSEGTIRNSLTEGVAIMDKTYHKLQKGALRLKGYDLLVSVRRPTSLLTGKIGPGGAVSIFDGASMHGDSQVVDSPEGLQDNIGLEAHEIEGESMHPFKSGWLVFFRRDHDGVTSDELNQICIVQLRNGRRYLKEVRRGYTRGLFNLHSWSGDTLEDQDIEWATKVKAIVPR